LVLRDGSREPYCPPGCPVSRPQSWRQLETGSEASGDRKCTDVHNDRVSAIQFVQLSTVQIGVLTPMSTNTSAGRGGPTPKRIAHFAPNCQLAQAVHQARNPTVETVNSVSSPLGSASFHSVRTHPGLRIATACGRMSRRHSGK
jgi:hypothetical protein